jgi:hypothetical protein
VTPLPTLTTIALEAQQWLMLFYLDLTIPSRPAIKSVPGGMAAAM